MELAAVCFSHEFATAPFPHPATSGSEGEGTTPATVGLRPLGREKQARLRRGGSEWAASLAWRSPSLLARVPVNLPGGRRYLLDVLPDFGAIIANHQQLQGVIDESVLPKNKDKKREGGEDKAKKPG